MQGLYNQSKKAEKPEEHVILEKCLYAGFIQPTKKTDN